MHDPHRTPTFPAGRPLAFWRIAATRLVLTFGLIVGAAAGTAEPAIADQAPPNGFSAVVKAQMPAVVNIATTQNVQTSAAPGLNAPQGSPMEDFLRDFFGNRLPQEQARKVQALGSGFIISADGLVVTNAHVIDEASEIQVILQDGRTIDAKLVGSDPATDLAVLKIEAGGALPHVEWGDSSATEVGDWVIAIGNPFGLGGSVSVGVLSARARDIQAGPYDDFLQTDAPINRGNSGGPLFDRHGKVIGVNTVILSPSGGNIGIGFAVPASTARPIVAQLRETGRVERGWLGVHIQPVTEGIAEATGLKEPRGALIANVTKGTPAEKAGLKAGDVIVAYGDEEIEKVRDLPRLVANTEIGSTVTLSVWRDGKAKEIPVTLGRKPGAQALAAPDSSPGAATGGNPGRFGLVLSDLTEQNRQELDLESGVGGALVTQVRQGSPAAEQGIRAGDVIVQVGGKSVGSAADAAAALQSAPKDSEKPVLVRINRGGDYLFVAMTA